MATQAQAATESKSDAVVEQEIQELRKIDADPPQYVKTALENGLPAMISETSEAQASGTESAGRIGVRRGAVSELTVIAPFAPGGAKRLHALLRLLNGNFRAGKKVGKLNNRRMAFV